MDELRTPTLVPIQAIPGLFISDRFAASSKQQLEANNVGCVLSVLQRHETSRSLNPSFEGQHGQIQIKSLEIDDDPLVDILRHLEEACDWIQAGLDGGGQYGSLSQPGVLVHCKQGISRSGAFIVAFLMKKRQLSFAAALGLARESRPQICPNSGFEKQLRIWEFCGYSVYQSVELGNERKEKPPYKAWKAERDNLLKLGEEDINRARFSSLAGMAARFGQRRQEQQESEKQDGNESWERVKKMENDWNEKLMRGLGEHKSEE